MAIVKWVYKPTKLATLGRLNADKHAVATGFRCTGFIGTSRSCTLAPHVFWAPTMLEIKT